MSPFKWILLLFSVSFIAGCEARGTNKVVVTTIHPIGEIIREIAGTKAEVIVLAEPGHSPHTYQHKPSDARNAKIADALFYVSDHLDGWVAALDSDNKISLQNMLPEESILYFDEHHEHNEVHHDHSHGKNDTISHKEEEVIDPHFWTDPLTVKAILPAIADTLAAIDPDNAEIYRANARAYAKRLDILHRQVSDIISDVRGSKVYLFHPSFRYFLQRYKLIYSGSIEPSPGKEATPQTMALIIDDIKASGVKAIFSEPQLSEKPAE
ncbi:MAG: metal ABC transporter substrate-binding protein, partial [Bacteroidota bacterium]